MKMFWLVDDAIWKKFLPVVPLSVRLADGEEVPMPMLPVERVEPVPERPVP